MAVAPDVEIAAARASCADLEGEAARLLVAGSSDLECEAARPWPSWRVWRSGAAALLAALLIAGAASVLLARHQGQSQLLRTSPQTALEVKAQTPTLSPWCQVRSLPGPWAYAGAGKSVQVKVLSFNLFWWNLYGLRKGNKGSASALIAKSGQSQPHDVMGFQECEDAGRVLGEAGLSDQYTILNGFTSRSAALSMAFRKASWSLLDHGLGTVAEDSFQQHYGERAAQWMRLRHKQSGKTLFFMNHHGPTPLNSGGICGGAKTAHDLLQLIEQHTKLGDAVIFVGDFNADGSSPTIRHLERRLHKLFQGVVYGGIDNMFSNLEPSAVVGTQNLGNGGSDHDALSLVMTVGSDAVLPAPALVLEPARRPAPPVFLPQTGKSWLLK